MRFLNRAEAGRILAQRLRHYRGKSCIVYALPRGGVVPAIEVAKFLHAPLDLVITRKIGHPYNPEYALAAISESGQLVNSRDVDYVDQEWFREELNAQRREAERRRKLYFIARKELLASGKIAILIDDGIATGLTMRAAILDLRKRNPKKIVVAVPIIPRSTFETLQKEADEVVAFDVPDDDAFQGAVGAYYRDFAQVSDEEVVSLLTAHEKNESSHF